MMSRYDHPVIALKPWAIHGTGGIDRHPDQSVVTQSTR